MSFLEAVTKWMRGVGCALRTKLLCGAQGAPYGSGPGGRSFCQTLFVGCISVFLAMLLLGCTDKAASPPTASASLSRPVLNLETRAGRLLVPASAIVERGGVPGVFVLTPQGQARFRMIRSGKIVNGRVEILSGLDGDETLVAGDLRDVHDGSLVKNILATDARR